MKRWVCDRMPGHVFREPGHVRCPSCRELPEAEHAAEHAAVLADEFRGSWTKFGFGEPPIADAVWAVFEDLLERKVIE